MCKKLYLKFMGAIAKKIFPKADVIYEEKPDDDVGIYCSNHGQSNGPALMTLWFNKEHSTWVINYVLDKKKAPTFIFHDFMSGDVKKCKWFWKILARIEAKLLRPLLELSNPIPVYHDEKNRNIPFELSIKAIEEGKNIVIFPESPKKFSEYVSNLYTGFTNLGKMCFEKLNKRIKFYPVYCENKNHKIMIGKPIQYDETIPEEDLKTIIVEFLRDSIDRLARLLPTHEGVPFLLDNWYQAYADNVDDMKQYWKKFE